MSHNHNLSVNSINSIIEPTTPPNAALNKNVLWDSNKTNTNLGLPTFKLDENLQKSPIQPVHLRQLSVDNAFTNKENFQQNGGARSKIDKEYLASISKLPLSSISSEILKLSKDQYGCRFLQKKVDENVYSNYATRLANFEIIFQEIYPHMYELIIDPFGNYLVQKLIVYCDELKLNLILDILQFNLFQISINQHGTRALQKIIDNLTNSYQLDVLIKGLRPYIIELIKDLNGNHVIQKILNKYEPENCQFIYDAIINDIYVVATHKHGCCVLQKCLNHVTALQLADFSNKILTYEVFSQLINDQFGNYVLQYLISIDSFQINYRMFQNFLQYGIGNLCVLKFSSNVIEKFLKRCYNNEYKGPEFVNLKFNLAYQIFINDLDKLINDPYGNYVIQTLIDILSNPMVKYQEPLLEGLCLLLPMDFVTSTDSLQVLIIKQWFKNCKIVSSFGKRIQLKINTILNGSAKSNGATQYSNQHSRSNGKFVQQNMNANGEFISSGQNNLKSNIPYHTRSFSLNSTMPQNKGDMNLLNSFYNPTSSNNYALGSTSTNSLYLNPQNMLNLPPQNNPYQNYMAHPTLTKQTIQGIEYNNDINQLYNINRVTQPNSFIQQLSTSLNVHSKDHSKYTYNTQFPNQNLNPIRNQGYDLDHDLLYHG